MEPLSVRFEQKRGHMMILERNPPLIRDELNETQLSMLKQCDIPGLLSLETEECDGQISLRYALSGKRMLTEALRTSTWSMAEMLVALCRLAEVLEECRLYLLDADRVRLLDEFIFIGEEWHDLKLTYLPIDMPTLYRADDLERLIIRWMMKVKEPDGHALQSILRLVASSGFTPIVLIRYIRQYLARSQGADELKPGISSVSAAARPEVPLNSIKPSHTKSPHSWDLLHPISGDLHPVSEIWGDGPESKLGGFFSAMGNRMEPAQEDRVMDIGRWRIVVVCVSLFLVAVAWRFIYLNQPSHQKLLACLCLTLILTAGIFYLWNGMPNRFKKTQKGAVQPSSREIDDSFKSAKADNDWDNQPHHRAIPRFPNINSNVNKDEYGNANSSLQSFERFNSPSDRSVKESANQENPYLAETSWISTPNDQTAYLNHKQISPQEKYCLIWKTKEAGYRIPLQGKSMVIGRSSEAAQHVDETMGISRAHVEFVREAEQWKVKDLGSRNGSRLNDKPMAPYELYPLQIGDCLTLANSQYCFQHAEG
ncbi:DUF6382 domain-containing protein [Cohnella mopanensis]|uniref:DUF6382 domain-containing protein n=1 Tax=Cohnella mopanensis TaxID=2911966 RepID=UPI001EF91624|nr:DUF6382 domain-containing protein [Cohnella mopanensis]